MFRIKRKPKVFTYDKGCRRVNAVRNGSRWSYQMLDETGFPFRKEGRFKTEREARAAGREAKNEFNKTCAVVH